MTGPVETFGKVDLKDALVLVAFPTTGSAANIAAHYLTEHLELPLVGHVRVKELQGVIAIQDGKVTSPVRVFGGEVACKLEGGTCPHIYVVTGDLPVPPQVLAQLGDGVVKWAHAGGARMLVVLEGVVRSEGDDVPDVFAASADPKFVKELAKLGVPAMARALIGGIAARILLADLDGKPRTGALIVEAKREHPDGRAAAALIAALARFLPDVPIDEQPLVQEATRIEAELKRSEAPVAMPSAASYI